MFIGFALFDALSDDSTERAERPAQATRSLERETRRVNAAARRFRRAVDRREAQLLCAKLLAPETRRRVESTMRMPCERFYRTRPRARGRLLIDRTRLCGRIAMVDTRTTAGKGAVMGLPPDPRRGWLFLRRLDIPPAPSPGRPGEQPEGLSVS